MHRDPTSTRMSAARVYRAELALLLLVGGTVYGWIAAYDTSTMAFQDSIEYLRLADFYRHFLFGAPLVESAEYYRSTRLPPLFPLLLHILFRWRPPYGRRARWLAVPSVSPSSPPFPKLGRSSRSISI